MLVLCKVNCCSILHNFRYRIFWEYSTLPFAKFYISVASWVSLSMTSSAYCLHVLHLSYSFSLSSQHCSRMILYTLSSVIHPLKSSAFVSIISAWSTSSPELPSVCYKLLYNIALLRSHVMVGSWKRVWFAWMLLAKSTNVVPRSYWQLPLSARLLK